MVRNTRGLLWELEIRKTCVGMYGRRWDALGATKLENHFGGRGCHLPVLVALATTPMRASILDWPLHAFH